jgi:hypothetical protein
MALSLPSAGCSRTLQRHSSGQHQHAPAAAAAAFVLQLATATSLCCCTALRGVARRSWCMRWPGTWGQTCCTSLQVGPAGTACIAVSEVIRACCYGNQLINVTITKPNYSSYPLATHIAAGLTMPLCCGLALFSHALVNGACLAGDLLKSCQDQGQRLLRAIMRVRARH